MEAVTRKTKRLLLVAALCNLAAAAAFALLFWQVRVKNERVSDLVNQIELQAKQEQALESARTLLLGTAGLRESLGAYFVPKDGTVAFLEALEELGRRSGVLPAVTSVEQEPFSGKQAQKLKVAVRGEGSWPAVLRFVGLVELYPAGSRVEQLAISRFSPGGSSTGPWRADVILRVLQRAS